MTRTSVTTTNFDADADGAVPAGFTNLNGFNANLKVVKPASDGKIHVPYGSPADVRSTSTFTNDQYATIVLSGFDSPNTTDSIGVGVRYDTTTTGNNPGVHGYRARVINGGSGLRTCQLFKVTTSAGPVDTETDIGGGAVNSAWVDGDSLTLEILGTSLKVYRNASVIIGPITDSTYSTGKPGLCGVNSGNDTLRGDSADFGNVTATVNNSSAIIAAAMNSMGV